jgi:tRNA(Ile)-lysidine synthase
VFTETLVTMQDRALSTTAADGRACRLDAALVKSWPASDWRDLRVAVAVSGGPDSVALLRALVEAKQAAGGRGDLVVLHLDHQVRGEASRRDAQWVRDVADGLGLKSLVETSSTAGARSEEALRDQRREFYRRAADYLGARFVATGHTADDQAETVLFRLLRGTGVRGAAGIRPVAPLTPTCSLVRPLLGATRGEVLAYLAAIGQSFCTDATNSEDAFARNWLRNQVLPQLAERFPTAATELAGFSDRAAEMCDLVETLAAELLRHACETNSAAEGRVTLQSAVLAQSPQALVVEALRLAWREAGWPLQAMTAGHWRQLGELAISAKPQAAVVFPGNVRGERVGDSLVLAGPKTIGSC